MKTVTRTVRSPDDLLLLIRFLERADLPLVVSIHPGAETRTQAQNRLQWRWLSEMAGQGDQAIEEYRAFCKLHFGVPIRREDGHFRAVYDERIKPLDYETKLACMVEPINMPVTRDMTVRQLTRYLDAIQHHCAESGIALTDPSLLGVEDYDSWAR